MTPIGQTFSDGRTGTTQTEQKAPRYQDPPEALIR